MPVLEDTLYYSNIRSGLHGETENEREVLVQEQRYCRARARKLSLETNRRRKALEERRKQWDVQEQRLRENILQQRHQRVQDATENFQRAHLSPSQRKRPAAFKRTPPNLDEALHHIQGSPPLYTHQSQFLSSASTTSRSSTSSPKPSGGARHLRALSVAEAYTKLLQESSLTNFRNNQPFFLNEQQETQTVLKEKEQADPQEYLDTPHSETESLSSLDSLENGEPQKSLDTASVCCSQQSSTCAQSFYLAVDPSKLQDPKSLQSTLKQSNNPCSPSHPSSSIAKSFLEEILNKEIKLSPSSHSPKDHESAEEGRSLQNLTREKFDNSKDQSQNFNAQSTLGCQKEMTQQDLAANSERMITHDNDRSAQGNILKDKRSVVAHCRIQTVPDTTPQEFSSLPKDFKSESKQQTRTLEEKYAKHVSETQTTLPASRSSFKAFSSSTAHLSITYQTDPSSLNMQPTETLSSSQLHKPNPDVDDATGLKRESKPLSMEESTSIHPSDPKNETDVTKLAKAGMLKSICTSADPVTHSATNNNVRFLKGILKNHLKSKSGNVKFTYTPGHLLFTKEVAILIRDSVELARAKLSEPEQNRTIKKKLRWFDEVDGVEGVDQVFRDPSRRANLPQQTHKQLSADHSDHVNLLTGVSKNISSKTSAGPQSSRQAWAEVGPQEIRTQEHIREPTSQRRALCIGGSRIPRRARSARAGPCPVTSRARKGTVIRPQSAREAQHVAKTQGKILVPRPPPKPEAVECGLAEYISKASCCDDAVQSRAGLQDLSLYRDTPDSQTIVHRPTLRTDAICVQAPPYCTYTHETGICSLSPPDALADSARRRCGENGICLDRTPTDEEISLLWHGVRNALASKDGDPQSFLAHNGPLSSSPQVSASLSHVTINGDSLISGVKGASRMGGFFLSSSNSKEAIVKSPIRRQAMESNMVKNRVSVENGRNQTAGATQRKPSFPYQVTVPKTQHPNKNGHAADSEGPEVSDAAHEVVDSAQTHKSCNGPVGPQSKRIQSLTISALSLEEQRILQSLERLNQRLQYVQDTAGGNPAVSGIFALGPAFNQTGETVGVTMRRRGASADNRTRTQQRY
ncbi:centrosomal protein of 126 kDa isoform X1 [Megalobrama amblycephala]|uniref:centrosomal protein of 126 kDa isoform X1 n=1 Tax=Megalobrama amblycephala TaxID=75352 RepID=UPI00201481DF|nr:centrosomal protein of 126 kDa isoform X1 [Megalobrama amblycephala]